MTTLLYSPTNETMPHHWGSPRAYIAIVLSGILVIATSLGIVGWWMGPVSGDLTRIGGYPETLYGWRGEYMAFKEIHYERTTEESLLAGDNSGDILIFGDSFSVPHEYSWIITLAARSGLQIRYVQVSNSFDVVMRYLTSNAFATHPPKAVIVQSVERALYNRATKILDPNATCELPDAFRRIPAATGAPLTLPQERLIPPTFSSFDEVFSRGAQAARKRIQEILDIDLGLSEERAIVVRLSRSDLFSNSTPDRTLLYYGDVRNHLPSVFDPPGWQQGAANMRCALRQLARAAGNTPFRLVVAPDKRSVYAPWITTPLPDKPLDLLAEARTALGARFIDIRTPMRTLAASGVRDIYWPNDTHWGVVGHRLAGEIVSDALLEDRRANLDPQSPDRTRQSSSAEK